MKTKATRRSALIAGITRYFEKAINFIEAHCTIQTLNNFTESSSSESTTNCLISVLISFIKILL